MKNILDYSFFFPNEKQYGLDYSEVTKCRDKTMKITNSHPKNFMGR